MPTETPTPDVFDDAAFPLALEQRRAHLLAMPESEVQRTLRLDPGAVYTAAHGASRRLVVLRDALIAQFGESAGELLDALHPAAMAAKQADADFDGLVEGNELPELHRQLVAKHAMVLLDAESLVLRGHLPAETLSNAKNTHGYEAASNSALVLASVLRRHWAKISGNTPISTGDLAELQKLGERLSDGISNRDQAGLRSEAADLRARALSDVFRIYDQLRRMTTYLRWREGDVDALIPSLYAGRGGRKRMSDAGDWEPMPEAPTPIEEPTSPFVPPATPSPNNGGPAFEA
jgi:hypothetical protein